MARYVKEQPAAEPSTETPKEEFQPRTPLGRRLWELRKRIVASGEPLLDWDDIDREIAERRGGVSERDL
jgi:hypothetical protein